ncbi:MAG: hypothetical protein HY241_00040 [Actinobacteria bacterium]|nr:hypothetical protein [Actinomycetota bacterium]
MNDNPAHSPADTSGWDPWLADRHGRARVSLTAEAAAPDDDVVRELADIYEHVSGAAHPDWAEFGAAMVRDHRLVLRLSPLALRPRSDG